MKKIIAILVVLLLFISGCKSKEVFRVDNTLIETEQETVPQQDTQNSEDNVYVGGSIEEDINAVDIKKDEKLTREAEGKHKTEEDVLVPQEEIEEEKYSEEDDKSPKLSEEKYEVLQTFNTQLPKSIDSYIQYDKYTTSYNYLLVLYSNINIREKPTTESDVVKKAFIFEKINLAEKVKGQYLEKYKSDIWYKVFWKEDEEIKYGYIFGVLGEPRKFQFEKMVESIERLKNEVENNKTAYITNYKNWHGTAPLYKGKTEDNYGIQRYQSAPAYIEPSTDSEFRYIQDGVLVSILDKNEKFYKIRTLNFEGEYWVPKNFISFANSIEELRKVIVVDRKNQNEGVFEYKDGKWNLISYVFATTGEKSKYKQPTDLGYFMAIQRRPKFLYLDDITREISGYAPYAIRFNGGAYIHGVPVEFEIVDGEKVDPGMQEYLYTIGTVPRSHKCVRNYTSHAKFLYDWIEIGKSAVIVIE